MLNDTGEYNETNVANHIDMVSKIKEEIKIVTVTVYFSKNVYFRSSNS